MRVQYCPGRSLPLSVFVGCCLFTNAISFPPTLTVSSELSDLFPTGDALVSRPSQLSPSRSTPSRLRGRRRSEGSSAERGAFCSVPSPRSKPGTPRGLDHGALGGDRSQTAGSSVMSIDSDQAIITQRCIYLPLEEGTRRRRRVFVISP